MGTRRARRLGLCLAALTLAGCAQGASSSDAPSSAAVRPTQAAAHAPTPGPAQDSRSCVSVQALMGHLSTDTARWSPNLDPFNPAMSARIATLSDNLVKQVPLADTPQLGQAVQANARAFADLASAMHGKNRTKVTRALDGTRVAYRQLKQICSFE